MTFGIALRFRINALQGVSVLPVSVVGVEARQRLVHAQINDVIRVMMRVMIKDGIMVILR